MDMKIIYGLVLMNSYTKHDTLDDALLSVSKECNLNGKITIYSCRLYDSEQAKIIRYFKCKELIK